MRADGLQRASAALAVRRRGELDRLLLALDGHDPQRTLERGYARIEGPGGDPVTSAAAARRLHEMTLRLHDGELRVRPQEKP